MLDLSPAETIRYYALAVLGAIVTAAGLGAALYMEPAVRVVTGMDNQIVWGLPHVVAIFLIVAASGVLNVASIGSVFSQAAYKSRAPLSGLLCIALLAGGLAVIMLDLGRADRLVVAATHFNWTSVFGWNVILYPGMFGLRPLRADHDALDGQRRLWPRQQRRLLQLLRYGGEAAT